ncbi:hypothetical protein GGI07_004213 [Coemansia sp. Benny D115]|nr:hypothetical protein GGI07_004213 [Coemansia sp. Benny D115]
MDPLTAQTIGHVRGVLRQLRLDGRRLLLAVSGGADSMALAYVVSQAAGAHNCRAVTVDHGFRAESAAEAQAVARLMHRLGVAHETRTLRWDSAARPSVRRLEEVARARRYLEIADVCAQQGVTAVLTGHHAGDQAETFLLRFLQQSGPYGLAGMARQTVLPFSAGGSTAESGRPLLVRPLLDVPKHRLVAVCRSQGIEWHEDASNADERIRRNALRRTISEAPAESPLAAPRILDVCAAMQGHRSYVNERVLALLREHAVFDTSRGTAELAADARLWTGNAAVLERLLAVVVGWVVRGDRPPAEQAQLWRFAQALTNRPCVDAGPVVGTVAGTVAAAGAVMLAPAAKRGWVFCRQPPRAGEIAGSTGHRLGASALWDERLRVRVAASEQAKCLRWAMWSPGDDGAMRIWDGQIAEHRDWLKKARLPKSPDAVLKGLPLVSVGDNLVYALGHPTLRAQTLGVAVAVEAVRESPVRALELESPLL